MLGQTSKVDPAGLQAHDRFDEVFERTTQAIEPPDHNGIARTRKVEHRLKLGTIIPDSTHHISVGSFDGGFRQRIFLERGGLLTFGDAHLSNLHSTISSQSFFQYGSGSIVWKLMEMVTHQTLFCRMDYQNCSV